MISNRNATGADSPAPCLRDHRTWHGEKILVVEDSYLLAEVIGDFLHDCGLEPVGPVGWLPQGCQLARERALDGALLDVKLHEALCFPVAAILKARDIPFVFMTGYNERSSIPPEFRAAPLICKPFEEDELRAALALFARRPAGDRAPVDVVASGFALRSARGERPTS
jgi:CheY-like chemotaxis protein